MTEKEIVKAYWKAMESNDFAKAAEWLSEDYECLWPQTSELVRGREDFIAVNKNYPAAGLWTFTLNSILTEGNRVVTDVTISDGSMTTRAITFHTVKDGLIIKQVEYWPDDYEAPEWRAQWVTIVKK